MGESRLEDHLPEICSSTAKAFEIKRLQAIENKQRKIERARQEEERKERMRLERIEQVRRELLFEAADKFDQVRRLENLIQEIEFSSDKTEELTSWLKWAKEITISLNPITRINDLIQEHMEIAEPESSTDRFN